MDSQQKVLMALRHSVRMESILHEHKDVPVIPPQAAATFRTSIFKFLELQNELQASALSNGLRFFNVTIKSHYLAHAAIRAHLLNPVFG
eukprot:12850753-Alexandrium_andersonii.AAC.1